MKVFSVDGKWVNSEEIAKTLMAKGFSVAVISEREHGYEDIEKVLSSYDCEYVLIEGQVEIAIPFFDSTCDVSTFVDRVEAEVADYEPKIGFDFEVKIEEESIAVADLSTTEKLLFKRALKRFAADMHLEKAAMVKASRLPSRRNEVWVVHKKENARGSYIWKETSFGGAAKKEANTLKMLKNKGLNVPMVLIDSENYILMEYIEGRPLSDFIKKDTKNGSLAISDDPLSQEVKEKFASWVKQYAEIMEIENSTDYFDLNNFIVKEDGTIYGFDFEPVDMRHMK